MKRVLWSKTLKKFQNPSKNVQKPSKTPKKHVPLRTACPPPSSSAPSRSGATGWCTPLARCFILGKEQLILVVMSQCFPVFSRCFPVFFVFSTPESIEKNTLFTTKKTWKPHISPPQNALKHRRKIKKDSKNQTPRLSWSPQTVSRCFTRILVHMLVFLTAELRQMLWLGAHPEVLNVRKTREVRFLEICSSSLGHRNFPRGSLAAKEQLRTTRHKTLDSTIFAAQKKVKPS